jgi:hypothetical protein
MSEKQSALESVSSSYRSRGEAFVEDGDDLVDTNQVQAQNASEHAGGLTVDGEEREPVKAPEGTVPNTVNEDAEDAAATRPVDEFDPESGAEDPTVISEGEE